MSAVLDALSNYKGDDVHCDLIIPHKDELEIIKETANILAYHHPQPGWETHIMIIPKLHVGSLLDLPFGSVIGVELLVTMQEIAKQINQEQGGCRIRHNIGKYQHSQHLHIHIAAGDELPAKK